MIDLSILSQAFRMSLFPGSVLIFQIEQNRLHELDHAIKSVLPVLKSANITCLAFSDDVSLVMVPESRRVIALAQATK